MDSRPRRYEVRAEPVGLQHATAASTSATPPRRALCGADVDGWIVFADRHFEPGSAASCQRCAQITSTVMRAARADDGDADQVLPAGLGLQVRARAVGQVVVLAATGRLSDVVDDVDLAARYALAGEPRGVVCDVSALAEPRAPGALRRLALNGRHPRDWPGVPLTVAGLDRRSGETLARKPLGRHLTVTASVERALFSAVQRPAPHARSVQLAPHPTAPRASRDFVSRSLLDWGLSRHLPAACLVVSELVTNAMIHAGTVIDLTASEHEQAVRIAVRDHSPRLPHQDADPLDVHGRGLTIVASLASAWGVLPHADGGKVVWAVIDSSPRAEE